MKERLFVKVSLFVVAAASLLLWSSCANAGERLYNGIVLPDEWPPRIEQLAYEPMPVPYLQSPPAVIDIDVGRQLFVDDFLIKRTTLKRTFHKVEPYCENPVVRPDKTWEYYGDPTQRKRGYIGPYAMVFSDGVWYDPADKLYKMWYLGGLLTSTCYAVSKDGIEWEKPSLDIKPGTNIVHQGNRDSSTVWLDLEEKNPNRRYKMCRYHFTPDIGLVLHFSADGIHWSEPAVIAPYTIDRSTVFYNPFRKVWVYSLREHIDPIPGRHPPKFFCRVRRYFECEDLLSGAGWKRGAPTLWVRSDRLDTPHPSDPNFRPQLYNLDAVAYESVLLGLFSIVRGNPTTERPKLNEVFAGFSRDGFHWYRPFRQPIIGVSERKGHWNWGNVQSAGGCCLVVGDKLYFYFSGRAGQGRLGKHKSFHDGDGGTGLGFLRRDGFASMCANENEGVLTTRPVKFSGKYLFVNVDADKGKLQVEILDKKGKVIEPFSRDNCLPVSADKTLQSITFKTAKDLSSLASQPVRFRFYLNNGSLYSFWVSPDKSGASYGYVAAGGPGFTSSRDTVGLLSINQNCSE